MKKLLIFLLMFSFSANAWYPTNNEQEFRLIAKSGKALSKNWTLEGQMFKTSIADSIKIVSGFRLAEDESAMGGSVIYPVNKYLSLAVAGDVNQKLDLGGAFWIHGSFEVNKIVFKPYVKVSNKKLGEGGVIAYFNVGGVSFHLGSGLILGQSGLVDFNKEAVQAVVIFGTSFSFSSKILNSVK